MRKVKYYKCDGCGIKFKTLEGWGKHVESKHPNTIPKGFTYARYYYYKLTGKLHGKCVICKGYTEWIEGTKKYDRFCNNPGCKTTYRNIFKDRMINRHGKIHLLNDPEQQRKMLAAKKMSGNYKFSDGVEVGYSGTYELDFLKMLDRFIGLGGKNIMGPSPHTYYYTYKNPNDVENEGEKFYIPDFYIPSINLEIEIKQTTNTHHKILRIDKIKEEQKDELMKSLPNVRYFKVVDKQYKDFFDYIANIDNETTITESMESVTYEPFRTSSDRLRLSDYTKIDISKIRSNMFYGRHSHINKMLRDVANLIISYKDISGELYTDKKNNAVGYFIVRKMDNIRWISYIHVFEAYRRKGLGTQMITRAVRKYKATNVSIPSDDSATIELFMKCGFVIYHNGDYKVLLSLHPSYIR